MYNNTVSNIPTRMLCGSQLICEARENHHIASENWPYPVLDFGRREDPYYAEVWSDGMDWSKNFWLLESDHWENPKAYPLLVFSSIDVYQTLEQTELLDLLRAYMWVRRLKLWIKKDQNITFDDLHIYGDFVWPHFHVSNRPHGGCPELKLCWYEHHSQPSVKFWMNGKLLNLKAIPNVRYVEV